MYDDKDLKSTQQSSNCIDYNISHKINLVAQRFLERFCYVSFSLKDKKECRDFYYTKSSQLKKLLQFDCGVSDYEFDSVIKSSINDLIVYGTTYIEQILYFDKEKNLCKIRFSPVRYKKMFRVFNRVYYAIKKYDGRIERGFINCNNLIILNLKELGYKKDEFRRIFKKMGKSESIYYQLMFGEKKYNNFDLLRSRKNYKSLKNNKKTFWTEDPSNEYISEPYLVYRNMQFNLLQKKFLDYILYKINLSLKENGKKYNFNGKIEYRSKIENYDEYFEKFNSGELNCEDLCKIIW